MKKPISVELDLQVNACYVAYGDAGTDGVSRTERLSKDVTVDYDALGQVIGIELLNLEPATLELVKRFAQSREFAFPRDLAAASVT